MILTTVLFMLKIYCDGRGNKLFEFALFAAKNSIPWGFIHAIMMLVSATDSKKNYK